MNSENHLGNRDWRAEHAVSGFVPLTPEEELKAREQLSVQFGLLKIALDSSEQEIREAYDRALKEAPSKGTGLREFWRAYRDIMGELFGINVRYDGPALDTNQRL